MSFSCGGPSLSGSMRAIEVKRGNKNCDTGRHITSCSKERKETPGLLRRCYIHPDSRTPCRSRRKCQKTAIYELKGKENKLRMSFHSRADSRRSLQRTHPAFRVEHNTYRTAFESDLNSPAANVQILKDGDLLKIFAVPGGVTT